MFSPLSDYLQKAGRQLRREGKKIAPHFDDVHIHALRTRFKKLRAVLHFAAAAGSIPGDRSTLPKASRKLYGAAGAIRDAQLHLLHISSAQQPPLPRMALWLAGRIASAQTGWNDAGSKDGLRKLRDRLDALRPESVRPAALRRYFRRQLRQMSTLAALPELSDEQLHNIRKLVKELQYLLSWSKRYWPEGHAAIKELPLRRIKNLGELAGRYNDLRNAIATLRHYARTEEDDAALQAAGTALKSWERERLTVREKLIREVGRMG